MRRHAVRSIVSRTCATCDQACEKALVLRGFGRSPELHAHELIVRGRVSNALLD